MSDKKNTYEQELQLQEQADQIVAKESSAEVDPEQARRDEALFKSLEKKKKKKRRKIIRTVILVILILAVGIVGGVIYLRRQVNERFTSSVGDVVSYDATVGSISTSVSGSGTLANVDEEIITVPDGVTIDEVVVSASDKVHKGDTLATLDMASVLSAMASVQDELDDLDDEIADAASDAVSSYISAGVKGRVKKIYGEKGQDVLSCMYEHGAIALISLDGYMAVDIPAGSLSAGDSVRVIRGNEKQTEISGAVDTVTTGTAVILVTDNGPEMDEVVTVLDEDGNELGSGPLYIHSVLRVTGISGTISYFSVQENSNVYATSTICSLTNTSFSANYEALIKERNEKEEDLLELMQIYRDGALLSPMDGSISSVDYDDGSGTSTASVGTSSYSMYSMTSTASTTTSSTTDGTDVVTISPDESMEISISVDESNILSLELGQTASITVNSIGDEVFTGTVTEINKTATSSSGVTRYSAVITLDKNEQMLSGMSAKVVVRIQGVDNAVIIPVEALHQTSSTSYVYTSYDEETKQFGGVVEVETGISNSSYVEITSGLKEGDTVYYTETESSAFATMDFGGMGGDFGGDFGGMGGDFGGMPSGGGGFGGGGGGMPGGRG